MVEVSGLCCTANIGLGEIGVVEGDVLGDGSVGEIEVLVDNG